MRDKQTISEDSATQLLMSLAIWSRDFTLDDFVCFLI